jgi:hypothetical protein
MDAHAARQDAGSVMAGPVDTLGKAVRANMLVTVECKCGNTRHYRAIDVGMAVGLGRHPESVRFGCTLCRTKAPTVSLRMLDEDRLPKLTIWRFHKGTGGVNDKWVPQRLR